MVYDPNRLKEVLQEWKDTIGYVKLRYAVKCNALKCLLKGINDAGEGFDIASKGELQKLIDLKVDPEKIIYSNPHKDEKQLIFAYNYGVRLTVADSFGELEKIKKFAPEMKVLWRISIDENNSEEDVISFAQKFGDPMNCTSEVTEKFQELYDRGYRINGIHFHAGSGHEGSSNFPDYLRRARQCMFIAKQIGHPMETLDVGGGFAGNEIGRAIVKQLKYTKNDPLQCEYMGEPGRFIASRLFQMCCRVIGKRKFGKKIAIYINDGIYHAMNKVATDGVSLNGQRLFFEEKTNELQTIDEKNVGCVGEVKATIYGHTCDGLDVVADNVTIPSSIEMGDWLCFGGMGAYTYSLISQFNNLESCTSILVEEDKTSSLDSDQEVTNSEIACQKELQLNMKMKQKKYSIDEMDYGKQHAEYIVVPPQYDSHF